MNDLTKVVCLGPISIVLNIRTVMGMRGETPQPNWVVAVSRAENFVVDE
jgi:hypothetical protein